MESLSAFHRTLKELSYIFPIAFTRTVALFIFFPRSDGVPWQTLLLGRTKYRVCCPVLFPVLCSY